MNDMNDLFDYRFEHKCRRCGKIDDSCVTRSDNNLKAQLLLLGTILWTALQLHMNTIHLCEDGGMGITDLIGCKKVKV